LKEENWIAASITFAWFAL